tara:strand:+ start:440 stop:730 length:291 start_codon:yes stop_codon:yes gene_type:complete
MSRYKDSKITTSKTTNKRRKSFQKYSTSYYQEVPKRNTDIYVITEYGDRLDNLAFQFYGDPHLWWFIARVNHVNTMNVEVGTSLRIPISIDEAFIE